MSFCKGLKCGLVTLGCLVLLSAFAGSGIMTLRADPYYFTLHAVLPVEGYRYFYCPSSISACLDILYAIQPELAKIGIDVAIDLYDEYTWWDIIWGEGWNHSGGTPYPPGGWDFTCIEWWMMPTGLLWLESLVCSNLTPPQGCNIFPWMNEKADKMLMKGLQSLHALDRQKYLWDWQEEFMHDPPMANMYYPRYFEVTPNWVEGWDPVVHFRDVSQLAINDTLFDEYAPDWRKTEPHTLIYGIVQEMWSLNPLFIDSQTDEWMCDLWFETLYDLSIDPWPPTGQPPKPWDFCSKPVLAASAPTFMEGANGPDTRARVLLRDNVYWSDGVKFNATDVKFTFDLVLNSATKAVARRDLLPVVEAVEIVNETCVDFILYAPYADLTTLLSDDLGLAIVPWHTLKDISPSSLKGHPSTWDWTAAKEYLPALGPFKLEKVAAGEYIEMVRNDLYFGYDLGWGPYGVEKLVLKWVPDPASRLVQLKTCKIDFGDDIIASIEVYHDLMNREKWPHLRVWQYDSPSSNNLFFNLDNPYLSNRYVRQAIAHAIPYERILAEILPSYGIEGYRGKTLITPLHYYTDPDTGETVHLYNVDLEPYEYNIAKAQMYMDMWVYAQEGTDYTLGPVGDADFSGVVRLADLITWARNFGTEPADWTFLPGNDIDPDFDNSGTVNLDDFVQWAASYGTYYPFEGAR